MSTASNRGSRPRLLDLFCGAGGAAMGYHHAGFEGVDIKPQPRYPFAFILGDALEFVEAFARELPGGWGRPIEQYDAIHASPPWQRWVRTGMYDTSRHPDLLSPTRELLGQTGLPWVIENVPGAPMRSDAILCGSHFGLEVRRHRWFEFSWAEPVMTLSCDHTTPAVGVYGHPRGRRSKSGQPWGWGNYEDWVRAMGIDWMRGEELAQAIPPAYTEFIGAQLMAHLNATVAA